jgi:myotubularin-related protein 5/13
LNANDKEKKFFNFGHRILRHILSLAEELYRNENPVATAAQPYIQKIPQPAEGAVNRVHQPVFPHLDDGLTQEIIQAGLERKHLE